MLFKLQISHHIMNIIPTSDKADEIVKEFYPILEEAMKITKKDEISSAWRL